MTWYQNKDLWSGLLFVAFGCFALIAGRTYEMGTAMQMGAGYVPRMLATLLCGIGMVVVVKALFRHQPPTAPIRFRDVRAVLVLLAVVTFALVLERLGVAIATFVLITLAGLAGRESRKREIAALALTLTALSIAVFVWGLGLPLRVWPSIP